MQRILIADDESEIRDLIAEALTDRGFKVAQAGDGAQAIQILREEKNISLLISDVRMPVMSGYTLAREAIALCPTLKVLMMTGYAADYAMPADLIERDIKTLHKPFNVLRLADEAVGMLALA